MLFLYCGVLGVLFMLWMSPLSYMSFVNIPPSVCIVFLFSWQCLLKPRPSPPQIKKQKFLILMKSKLSIFFFRIVPLVLYLKVMAKSRSSTLSHILSSRCFIVLHFKFRFMIHSEFLCFCVRGIRSISKFKFLHVDVHHHLLKNLVLSWSKISCLC